MAKKRSKSTVVRDLRVRSPGAAKQPEAVVHPDHYGGDTVYEAWKVIRAWELNFSVGNAVKYLCRAGKKPGSAELQDLRKAVNYLQDEIRHLERREREEQARAIVDGPESW